MNRCLNKADLEVVFASSGNEGIILAQHLSPNLIYLDVMMPEKDGWDVLSQLKAKSVTAHIPVGMMTIVDEKHKGCSLGATDYILKPFDRTQVLNILEKYIAIDN